VIGVFGEIFVTAGVLVGLFVVWQVWINNEVAQVTQASASVDLSQQWADEKPTAVPDDPATPIVMPQPAHDETFANLIVPRFGEDFRRPIGQGVGFDVINDLTQGMGHYEQSQMPGEVGNFALASHRSAYGGAFHVINELELGDPIYVETEDGWYKYIYRNTEYVPVTGIGVIDPVPQNSEATPTERYITLTTCNPLYSSAERMIAYGVFDSWYPRADGPPPEIAEIASAKGS
jgi:sortase A